MIVIVYMLFS